MDRSIDGYKRQVGEQVAPKLNTPRPTGMDQGYLITNTIRASLQFKFVYAVGKGTEADTGVHNKTAKLSFLVWH